nr:hypothetical protein [Methylobacterium sp. Leaf122]
MNTRSFSMADAETDFGCSSLLGTAVHISLGSIKLRGSIRAIGDTVSMPKPGAQDDATFRQVVIDLDDRAFPLELWLADEEFSR